MILRQHQSISGGGTDAPPHRKGDCFRTCIANALAVPIPAIPHFAAWIELGDDDWWPAVNRWLREHYGVELVCFAPGDAGWTKDEWGLPGIWLASVKSLNLSPRPDGAPERHVVLMRGAKLAHDPSTAKRYRRVRLDDVLAVDYFRLVEPCRVAA